MAASLLKTMHGKWLLSFGDSKSRRARPRPSWGHNRPSGSIRAFPPAPQTRPSALGKSRAEADFARFGFASHGPRNDDNRAARSGDLERNYTGGHQEIFPEHFRNDAQSPLRLDVPLPARYRPVHLFTKLLARPVVLFASLSWKSVAAALNSRCLALVAVISAEQLHGRREEFYMTTVVLNRRNLLAASGSVLVTGISGLLLPASAQGVAPTPSMSGGSNNYLKGAAIVERIGKGGFWMSGTVRRAGDGAPLAGQRIQIWAHTVEGREHEPQSHGATLTDKDGKFRLEMPQIIPVFGQPHGHLAYDSGEFQTVFLRPVMRSAKEASLEAHFVLQPV
jgi:hypothetical protein